MSDIAKILLWAVGALLALTGFMVVLTSNENWGIGVVVGTVGVILMWIPVGEERNEDGW